MVNALRRSNFFVFAIFIPYFYYGINLTSVYRKVFKPDPFRQEIFPNGKILLKPFNNFNLAFFLHHFMGSYLHKLFLKFHNLFIIGGIKIMASLEHIRNLVDIELKRISEIMLMKTGLIKKFPKESSNIAEYVYRKGKRIRPTLFILSYKGFSSRTPDKLFSSAAALELMHTFALIQDDVIDNSDSRLGSQSLYCVLMEFCKNDNKKGKDLAIVVSDLLYSYAMKIFNDIDENLQ